MMYIDTHVAIWLTEKKLTKFPKKVRHLLEVETVIIPAMVELELHVLSEIGKTKSLPGDILASLEKMFGAQESLHSTHEVCRMAQSLSWTRDIFDRLIVAESMCAGAPLITKDSTIQQHYPKAVW